MTRPSSVWRSLIFSLLTLPTLGYPYLINEWEPVEIIGESRPEAAPSTPGKPWVETIGGMRFIWVGKGCYKMGSSPSTEGRDGDEGPVHQVCLSSYWIAEREVTQGAWRRIMRTNPAHFRKGDDYPVERVAWDEVEGFVAKLNQIYPGEFIFRLPTEAEWEYVCTNKGQRVRYAGSQDVSDVGWYENNSNNSTQPAGLRKPNQLGIYDLSGNVWEWMLDAYQGDAYRKHSKQDPKVQSDLPFRVIRGGSFDSQNKSLRCANRGFELFSSKMPSIGFRLVRVAKTDEDQRRELRDLEF
ncbi:MAG: formylglycine-generating enzyme family protein [Magnetococcales bacterium]|nr:formylglycine-generating enzyme family protein [Magnetococcales bacterium]NGZ27236.1 formylglycine-generating enzyme family protein [Magnetococcales bacterium]